MTADSTAAATAALPASEHATPAPTARTRQRPRRKPGQAAATPAASPRPGRSHPLWATLAQWYPMLFGETLRPLKRGIFHDLMAAHPELDAEELKQALALHTRSTRYLSVMASGQPRHDLQGQAVEALAPEHIHHALLEVFRRRQQRSNEDLQPKLRQRIVQALQASGLSREAYAELVRGRNEQANAVLDAALAEAAARDARDEALLRTFEASGQSDASAFAAMYGLHPREVSQSLARAQQRQAALRAAQAAPTPAETPADNTAAAA